MKKIPIIVMSFNRPDMLANVLRSAVKDLGENSNFGSFYLFQDGGFNLISGKRYANEDEIQKCVKVFNDIVPNGLTFVSSENLGVALNFERAEKFVFQNLNAPAAVFLEDDLELCPGYFDALKKLIDHAINHPSIGMVSAYGVSPTTPRHQQERMQQSITHMGQNWGFALTKRHWEERNKIFEEYMKMVRNIDYRDRPLEKISSWRNGLGFQNTPTSQDDCKNISTIKLGVARICTYANFAKYIGSTGLHMNQAQFKAAGFDDAAALEYTGFPFLLPNEAEISDILFSEITARSRNILRNIQKDELLPSMVRTGFRLFLGRDPGQGNYDEKISLDSRVLLAVNFLSSLEYRYNCGIGLDLCAVTLNRKPVAELPVTRSKEAQPTKELVRDACIAFLGEEEDVYEYILSRNCLTRFELIRAIMGHPRIRTQYAKALGTEAFFLQ